MSLCKEIKPLLPAYADGELSANDAKLVADHAAGCAACRAELAAYRKTHALLAGLDEVEPPPWLADKIMAHVRDEAGKEPGLLRRIFYPLHIKIPIPAVATVFIVCLVFYLQKGAAPPYEAAPVPPPGQTMYEKAKQSPKAAKMRAPVPDAAASGKSLPAAPPAPSFAPAPQAAPAPAALPPAPAAAPMAARAFEATAPESAARLRADEGTHRSLAAKKAAGQAAPASVDVTLHADDLKSAAGEVESLLHETGAQNVRRKSEEGSESVTGEIQREEVAAFVEKLDDIGDAKATQPAAPAASVPIKVKVVPVFPAKLK